MITRTISGNFVDLFKPKPGDFCAYDIAHALSHTCRWGGHTPQFYSVLMHSLHVSYMVPEEHALAALLHDASEAFICDIPKPVKLALPHYSKLEYGIMRQIAEDFDFSWPLDPVVKEADAAALWQEATHFWPGVDVPGVCPAKPPVDIGPWPFTQYSRIGAVDARGIFLCRLSSLS